MISTQPESPGNGQSWREYWSTFPETREIEQVKAG